VFALQVNYADQSVDSSFLGKAANTYHQYIIYHSPDGKNWSKLVDKSKNLKDVPHDYIELAHPVTTRYLRIENLHMPTGTFALSGFRVFGKGRGAVPDSVAQFLVLRGQSDRRNAWLKWSPVANAWAYNIYVGVAPDKLYNCIMVHNTNEYYFKAMDREQGYYFSIEAINENGVSKRSAVIPAQ
jgi:hypothetical protein